jgi:hypothetical protein
MEQVAKTINYTVTSADVTAGKITLMHNLGYYAFADVWAYSQDSNFGGIVARKLNSFNPYTLYMGKQSIQLPTTLLGGAQTLYAGDNISVKLYSFDFTKAFGYSAITPPVGSSSYDPHVGIKIVRPGRNIDSRDLRDFVFHSKGSAPQILTVQTPENANVVYTVSGSTTKEVVTYQIPFGIPARLDFVYSTDATSWEAGTGTTSWAAQVLEASTGLAYYATVYGQYDTQSVGDVSYTMTNTGLFTSFGLYKPVPFSVIVRRDPLLYSAPTVLTI